MKKLLISLLAVLCVSLPVKAQEDPEGWNFGGWEFFEVYHDFGCGPFFGSFYFEHDNLQYRIFDEWYTRTTFGAKLLPWLKADVAYDFHRLPSAISHKFNLDVTGTLASGPLKASVRERYVHSWTGGSEDDVLRSRLMVRYSPEKSRWSPYLAVEVFTWGVSWKKTRHYVACDYSITPWMQLEAYYLYYTHSAHSAQHIIGIGLNFEI